MKRLFFLGLVVAALFLVFYNTCHHTADTDQGTSDVVAVLTVNDMHAAIDMMPQFAALADSLREVYPELLVFSAGDNRTGNPVNDQYNPTNYPMIALMNKVGFDVSAVGNHDWDGGLEALQTNIKDAEFPFLCANVNIPQNVSLDVKPYVILENQGFKVAVLGLLETRPTGIPSAHPSNFKKVSFRQAMEVIPEYRSLRDEADIFILLSHLGYDDDRKVAERYPMFDAILGGHTHTLVESPEKCYGVMITQAGSRLEHAVLTLFRVQNGKVTDVRAKTLDVKHFGRKDKEVQAMVDYFNSDKRFDEALATARTDFNSREELGCMVTDAIRTVSDADFAFTNTGGLRMDYLKKGPITVRDVYKIDPFGNEIVLFKMNGKQLERFIMESFKKNGKHPSYVSGMKYTVNTDVDGYPTSVSIKPDKGTFSKNATYKVAMNDYMASTVHFESLDDGESLFMTSEEMLIQYLRSQKSVSYQGVRRTFY